VQSGDISFDSSTDIAATEIIEIYYKNGNIECREYLLNNKRHRLDGPAVKTRYANAENRRRIAVSSLNSPILEIKETYFENGNLRSRECFLEGELHRLDGPAYEGFYLDGILLFREWRQNGLLHRLDGPACQEFYKNGALSLHVWYVNNSKHRLNEPAYEAFSEHGKLISRQWYQDDKLHRIGAPAYEEFHHNGALKKHIWCEDGLFHRLDGPAWESFFSNGKRDEFDYWLYDEILTPSEHRQQVALMKLTAKISDRGVSL
jgi:antitoxin component YwqK of YwqJK toxin-antitoxin module